MKNQVNKADGGKIKPRLLIGDMASAIKCISAVLSYGAEKYEERGWASVNPSRYEDALLRHYLANKSGEPVDKESGLPHLAHLACNALFLLEMELRDKGLKGIHSPVQWNSPPQDHKS